MKQLAMFENMPTAYKVENYKKQKWRNKLQKYCDREALATETSAYCKCGWMKYCDYCNGSGKTNACVKAICELAEEKHIKINYEDFDFEKFIEMVEE